MMCFLSTGSVSFFSVVVDSLGNDELWLALSCVIVAAQMAFVGIGFVQMSKQWRRDDDE